MLLIGLLPIHGCFDEYSNSDSCLGSGPDESGESKVGVVVTRKVVDLG